MAMSFLVLPSISEDFGVTLRAVGWFVIVDALVVSALLLPMGALADAMGRRRVLLAGLTVFGTGAVLTGLAPTFGLLIAARLVMAVGNALVQSISTGMLVAAFPPEERGLAIGSQTTSVAVGSATGPLIVGLALDVLAWDTLFMLLAIPSAISVAAVWTLIPPDETLPASDPSSSAAFDRVGAALAALSITVLVITINNPFDVSWLSPISLGGAAVALVLIARFIGWELDQSSPMLDLRLFAIPLFRWAVVIRVVTFLAATTTAFLFPIYLLSVRELSTSMAGLVLSFGAVGMGFTAQVSGRLFDRVGPRPPTIVGLVGQCAVNLALAFFLESTPVWLLALGVFANGVVVALWNVPNNSAMLAATPPESFGVGGAFTNVTRTVGNVLGQAFAAAVVVAVMASKGFDIPLGEVDETAGAGEAFLDGWRVAYLIAAILPLLCLAAARQLPGRIQFVGEAVRSRN